MAQNPAPPLTLLRAMLMESEINHPLKGHTMKNSVELNEHLKMVFTELMTEQNKPVKKRNYFYIKLLEQELGFELACILQDKGRHFT